MALAASIVQAQLRGQTVWIPMQDDAAPGSPVIELEGTLYKPEGEGPFPLVIYNHGSTGPGVVPADRTDQPAGFGRYLTDRGIALLAPMRRGRGRSEGEYRESYECSLHASRSGVRYAAEALDAVYAYLKTQPWVDRERIVLFGVSRGGLLSVVYAAERPGAAIGAVNMVGGWMGDRCSQRAGVDINAVLFADAGKVSQVPNLFLYATRDPYYAATNVETYASAFRDAGGSVEFKLYEAEPGANGHRLFFDWRKWMPDFDAFLHKLGMSKP